MKRIRWVVISLLALIAVPVRSSDSAEPTPAWAVKADKDIHSVNIMQEKYILISNKARLWCYDVQSGQELGQTEIKDYENNGFELIWNERTYIASTKKGLVCLDIATGQEKWSTPLQGVKTQDYENISWSSARNRSFG